MTRKKRRKYKLLQPLDPAQQASPRAQAIVTIVQWAFWCALAGIFVAFGLILTLFTHFRVSTATWLNLWPSSIHLMDGINYSNQQMSHLALRLTLENALRYCIYGLIIGSAHVSLRSLRHKLRASRV